jgi:hypothetical protein
MFSDDIGRLLRIESERIPPKMEPLMAGDRLPDTLEDFFEKAVLAQAFRSVSPDASVMYREHNTAAGEPAFFTVVMIPGGSTLTNANTGRRYDSVRGVLVFARDGFLYAISNQEWPVGDNLNRGSLEHRCDQLLNELNETVSTMTSHTR